MLTGVHISTINSLKSWGNCMSQLLQQYLTYNFFIYGFHMLPSVKSDYFLKLQKTADLSNAELLFYLRYRLNYKILFRIASSLYG